MHGSGTVRGLTLVLSLWASLGAAQQAESAHEKGCKKGEPAECFSLALAYQQGLGGTVKDEARAATLFQKACDKGHLEACNNLGIAYAEGQGVHRDPKQSIAL